MDFVDREILEAVAEGRLTPDEAAARLEQTARSAGPDADSGRGGGQTADAPPVTEPPGPDARAARVRISATARTVRVIGDASVSVAEADGPHRVWRDGDVLVISGSDDAEAGFSFRSRRRSHRDWRDWSDLTEWRRITEPLVVRVNPDLAVAVEVSAGALSVFGLHGPLQADLAAGSARLEAVTGPLDVTARAGSVRIQGRLVSGTSRIRCDAGSATIRLDPGSSLRVRAHVDLGRLRLNGRGSPLGGSGEVVIGGGAGLLDVEAAMASIDITTDDPIAAAPVGP